MTQEKKLLEVGDVVYNWRQWGGMERLVIDRVTEKQAFYKGGKCNREIIKGGIANGRFQARKIGEYGCVDLETVELTNQFNLQQRRRRAKNLIDRVSKIDPTYKDLNDVNELIELLTAILSKEPQPQTN